jgi:hypothetical protein
MDESKKPIERSVDSLQRIYSFILALSLGQAINILVVDSATRQLIPLTAQKIFGDEGKDLLLNVLPIALAFFATIIPFHQGMNRHLDYHYIEHADVKASTGLLLDFIFFMAEGCLFFAIASSVRQPHLAFVFFGLLLAIDITWALIARIVHRSSYDRPLTKWPGINFVVLIAGLLILAFNFVGTEWKSWLFFFIALGRTVWDYKSSWRFYFPFNEPSAE